MTKKATETVLVTTDYLTLFYHTQTTLDTLIGITSKGAGLSVPPKSKQTTHGVVFYDADDHVVGFNLLNASQLECSLRTGLNYPSTELLSYINKLLGIDLHAYANRTPFVVGCVQAAELIGHVRACLVDVGQKEPQAIVCGGKNVRVGMNVVVVLPGGIVADGKAVFAKTTYGKPSAGMICSARELGFNTDDSDGMILELPADSVVGSIYNAVYQTNKVTTTDVK